MLESNAYAVVIWNLSYKLASVIWVILIYNYKYAVGYEGTDSADCVGAFKKWKEK